MSKKEIRKSLPLFPIGIVMELTELSARQIRYYEEHQLVVPKRSKGNQRLFSLNDIDKLLEIKELLEQGVNIAGIKKIFSLNDVEYLYQETKKEKDKEISEDELRELLRNELLTNQRLKHGNLRQGDLYRFFS